MHNELGDFLFWPLGTRTVPNPMRAIWPPWPPWSPSSIFSTEEDRVPTVHDGLQSLQELSCRTYLLASFFFFFIRNHHPLLPNSNHLSSFVSSILCRYFLVFSGRCINLVPTSSWPKAEVLYSDFKTQIIYT